MVSVKEKVRISSVAQEKIIRSFQTFSRRTIGWALIFNLIMGSVSPAMGMMGEDEEGGAGPSRRVASSTGSSSTSGTSSSSENFDIEEMRSHLEQHPKDFTQKKEELLNALRAEEAERTRNIEEIGVEIERIRSQVHSPENQALVVVLEKLLTKGRQNLQSVMQKQRSIEEAQTVPEFLSLLTVFSDASTEDLANLIYQPTGITAPMTPTPVPSPLPSPIEEEEIEEGDPLMQALAAPGALPPNLQGRFDALSARLARELTQILEEPGGTTSDAHVILLGSTGVGKTVLNHWLTHKPLEVRPHPEDSSLLLLLESANLQGDRPISTGRWGHIAFGDRSETHEVYINTVSYPASETAPEEKITYADCPGYQATQGIFQEIKDALHIHKLLKKGATKFLLVISHDALSLRSSTSERGLKLREPLEKLKQMVPTLAPENVGLVVTGYGEGIPGYPSKANIPARITSIAHEEPDPDTSTLLASLRNIAVFSQPTNVVEDFFNDQEKAERLALRGIIRNLTERFVGSHNSRIPLSSPASHFLNRVRTHLTEDLKSLLKEKAVPRIIDYCRRRISETRQVVEADLARVMEQYSFVRDIILASGVGAVTGGGVSAAAAGWMGGVAAVAAAAPPAIATWGMTFAAALPAALAAPLAIPALIGGGLFVLTLVPAKKRSFRSKTLESLKEARRKDLREEFNYFAKTIRGTKFGLENSLLLTDLLPRLGVDPQVGAEILEKAQTLSTITSLLEHSGEDPVEISFARNVWPVFSLPEQVLRILKRRSAEEFYESIGLCNLIQSFGFEAL